MQSVKRKKLNVIHETLKETYFRLYKPTPHSQAKKKKAIHSYTQKKLITFKQQELPAVQDPSICG